MRRCREVIGHFFGFPVHCNSRILTLFKRENGKIYCEDVCSEGHKQSLVPDELDLSKLPPTVSQKTWVFGKSIF